MMIQFEKHMFFVQIETARVSTQHFRNLEVEIWNSIEPWKKVWLFRVYRGLYCTGWKRNGTPYFRKSRLVKHFNLGRCMFFWNCLKCSDFCFWCILVPFRCCFPTIRSKVSLFVVVYEPQWHDQKTTIYSKKRWVSRHTWLYLQLNDGIISIV